MLCIMTYNCATYFEDDDAWDRISILFMQLNRGGGGFLSYEWVVVLNLFPCIYNDNYVKVMT